MERASVHRPARPALGGRDVAAPDREEAAAALEHRPDQQGAVGRGGPVGQHPLDLVPPAGPQLQLAQVQPGQGVGLRPLLDLAPEGRQDRPRLLHLAPPHQLLPGDPLRVPGHGGALGRQGVVALDQVRDRTPAQGLGPGERVDGEPLVVGGALLAQGDGLGGAVVGARDLADHDDGVVLGEVRTAPARAARGRPPPRPAPARGARRCRRCPARAGPRSAGGTPSRGRRPGGSDSRRGPRSSVRRCFSPASWRCRPRASTRSTSDVSGGVSRQACAARSIASRVAPRAAARAAAASRPAASSSSGTVRRQGQVEGASLLVGDDLGQPTVELALLVLRRLALGRGRQERVGGPDTLAVDGDHARRDRRVQGRGAREVAQLADPQVRRAGRWPAAPGGRARRGRRPEARAGPRRRRGRAGRRRGCRGRDRPASGRPRSRTAGCPSSSRTPAAAGGAAGAARAGRPGSAASRPG